MSKMTLHSGHRVDLENIDPSDMGIEDIAHSLSMICRFGGHTERFYSVAQHSVRVANVLPPELQLTGLLHDATEAIVGDMIRPIKRMLPDYMDLEDRVWGSIAIRYNLPSLLPTAVLLADEMALKSELLQLMNAKDELSNDSWEDVVALPPVEAIWTPYEAKLEFLRCYSRVVTTHRPF